jgi:hypothetical protein
MEESSTDRGKHLIGKIFLLLVIENSSCRNASYGRNITWKRYEFFSGNMNSLWVIENSSFWRSSYRSSTIDTEGNSFLARWLRCKAVKCSGPGNVVKNKLNIPENLSLFVNGVKLMSSNDEWTVVDLIVWCIILMEFQSSLMRLSSGTHLLCRVMVVLFSRHVDESSIRPGALTNWFSGGPRRFFLGVCSY